MGTVGTIFGKQKGWRMIRWIWSFIMKWGWDFNRNLRNEEDGMPTSSRGLTKARLIRGSDDIDSEQGLNITVGGKIITFRTYDHKTDRHNHRLYVIHDELDFERELGKLITLESIRS
jgi:hypothetical protein